MSEHIPKHEAAPSHEGGHEHHEHQQHHEQVSEADAEHGKPEQVASLSKTAETHATSGKELAHGELHNQPNANPTHVDHKLKRQTYERTLGRVRQHLSAPSRALSRVVHQPTVEKVSEVVGKTAARPSGFFGGSLFALVGSLVLLYITKHNGYEYNYLAFSLLFIGGFLAGMIIELGIWAVRHRKQA